MSTTEELKQVVDMHESKHGKHTPEIAARLEKESAEILKKRQSLTKDDVEGKLKEAEERRQAELKKKIETAEKLEGEKGKVSEAAKGEAPPQGTELPYSPVNKQ